MVQNVFNFAKYASVHIIFACISSLLIYNITLLIYRLIFSPICHFPGPKIAAVSGWYEFYHDFFKRGTYIFRIQEMHQKYGPIVRINPNELSIQDSDFYSELYVVESKRRTDNYHEFVKGLGFDDSHFLSEKHDLHRRRRKPLEPYFSRSGVKRLSPILNECVLRLTNRIEKASGTKVSIRLDHAFTALTGDIIRKICCESTDNFLDDPDFAPYWFNTMHLIITSLPLFTAFPFLIRLATFVPEFILLWISPQGQNLIEYRERVRNYILDVKAEKEKSLKNKTVRNTRESLFRHLLDSDIPASETSTERLTREAQVLFGAGTASTARTLDFISFYVLADSRIHRRLTESLSDVMSAFPQRIPSHLELEKIAYLHSIIKEGLRLSYGVMHRLPRCSPDQEIIYKAWSIPASIPIGMSAYFMHSDPSVYPEPDKFLPERWMGAYDPLMDRNFVPFSKGSRQCLGINLAYAEMHLALAVLFRPGGPKMSLYETDETDAVQVHDFLLPLPKLDTKGIRVKVG